MHKPALNAAFIFAALSVILGAFGAHALQAILDSKQLASFETAVKYQMYHSFALAIAGILYGHFPSKWIRRATNLFIAGIILFSGSIYLLVSLKATSDIGLGKFGLITPLGGILLILAWICLLMGVNARSTK
jgi:uncharacterized membrane protein YgdD (TMEM256/DUF423 family)